MSKEANNAEIELELALENGNIKHEFFIPINY